MSAQWLGPRELAHLDGDDWHYYDREAGPGKKLIGWVGHYAGLYRGVIMLGDGMNTLVVGASFATLQDAQRAVEVVVELES